MDQPGSGAVVITWSRDEALRRLPPELAAQLDGSPLPLLIAPLYMHYGKESDLADHRPTDQSWQNQAVYFWKAEEPFLQKSLPLEFNN